MGCSTQKQINSTQSQKSHIKQGEGSNYAINSFNQRKDSLNALNQEIKQNISLRSQRLIEVRNVIVGSKFKNIDTSRKMSEQTPQLKHQNQ